jgi:hypothetical protein
METHCKVVDVDISTLLVACQDARSISVGSQLQLFHVEIIYRCVGAHVRHWSAIGGGGSRRGALGGTILGSFCSLFARDKEWGVSLSPLLALQRHLRVLTPGA